MERFIKNLTFYDFSNEFMEKCLNSEEYEHSKLFSLLITLAKNIKEIQTYLPETLTLGGDSEELEAKTPVDRSIPDYREQTIMLVDISGFNGIVETSSENVNLIHSNYICICENIIKANNGVIHNFQGDQVLASFNCLKRNMTHELSSCRSALKIVEECEKKLNDLCKDFGVMIGIKVGIISDKIYCGSMGSENIKRYTHLGYSINKAHSLTRICKDLGSKVVCDQQTWEKSRFMFEMKQIEICDFKGEMMNIYGVVKEKEIKLNEWNYQIGGMLSESEDDRLEKIWRLYSERKFEECLENIKYLTSPIPTEMSRIKERIEKGDNMILRDLNPVYGFKK